MINQWKQYLQQIGACFDDNGKVTHFSGQPALAINQTILIDLSHLAMIQISGKDALTFLQSQFTNDVRQVNAAQSQLSAWCNPKGRVIVNFRLFQRQATYYMVFPQESVTTVFERLGKYILRADVKVAVTDDLLCSGLAGELSPPILAHCLGHSLSKMILHGVLTEADMTIIKVAESPARYLIISEIIGLKKLWDCAATTALPVGNATWQLLDILSGIPQVVAATTEEFVPQMINLQTLEGVNFKKGCYPGQEVVARMQYLATHKRQMFLLKTSDAQTIPLPGDALYTGTRELIGKIVNAVAMPEGGYAALAVLPAEQSAEMIQDAQGIILQR